MRRILGPLTSGPAGPNRVTQRGQAPIRYADSEAAADLAGRGGGEHRGHRHRQRATWAMSPAAYTPGRLVRPMLPPRRTPTGSSASPSCSANGADWASVGRHEQPPNSSAGPQSS